MSTWKLAKMVLIYFAILSLLKSSAGFEYDDLLSMEASCFPKDTCNNTGKRPRLDDYYDWKSRNCFCDDMCAEFGDCCLDAQAYVAQEQVANVNNYECVDMKQFGSLYMKGKCMTSWEDQYIADMCKNSFSQRADPLVAMPVTSVRSFVTYTNYFCAICNNDSNHLEVWQPRLECPTLKEYQNKHRNLSREYVTNHLIFDDIEDNWGLHITDRNGEKFHLCYVYPSMPETVIETVRQCKPMTKDCSSNWTDNAIKDLCHSYTAVRYKFDHAYRNIHCALCNDQPQNKTSCLNESFTRSFFDDIFNTRSFALLFDFSDQRGSNIVGSTSTCKVGEVYDPFFKKCRNVICGRENQQYRYGRCVDLNSHVIPTSTEIIPERQTTEDILPVVTTTSSGPLLFSASPNSSLFSTTQITPTLSISLKPESTENSTKILDYIKDISTPIIPLSIQESPNTTSLSSTEGNDFAAKPQNVSSVPNTDSERASSETFSNNGAINDTYSIKLTNDSSMNSTSDSHKKPTQTKACERFLLPKEEYIMNDNGTVLVEKYKRTYQISEYVLSEDGILVCIVQNDSEKFSKIMGWITIGGLGLSCVCLLLHLLAFIFVKELRNLSGNNLASFCLVLLGAFSSFILSVFREPAKVECYILATCMYYFFLASFCWVNVMAFDIWRTLSLATSELRVTSGKQCCKYMVYSVYGWLLPAAAVLGVVLLDKVKPEFMPTEYYPAFGEYWCWFGHRKALLVFFAAPLMAIMLLNIALFILSARIIANTMDSTAKMTTCSPYQSQFKLYMRLALLMGLTWISGIVAGYLQVEAVWYIFVVLNTLQGVFIFIAFTCTRKVWRALYSLWCRRGGRRYSWACRSPSSSKQGLQSTTSNMSQLSNQSNSSPTAHLTSGSRMNAI
ncbi:hypothetical protein SK128_003359 [Halocaridina rubra]|uniref:G-protein coupled receptor Mth2 n=1 Tax=Halocaridina rubra TaxID=373956 RepID=A0AAN9FUD0_HALRR